MLNNPVSGLATDALKSVTGGDARSGSSARDTKSGGAGIGDTVFNVGGNPNVGRALAPLNIMLYAGVGLAVYFIFKKFK